jgi:hypothetical protein
MGATMLGRASTQASATVAIEVLWLLAMSSRASTTARPAYGNLSVRGNA